jgi:MoxR-like ATPase
MNSETGPGPADSGDATRALEDEIGFFQETFRRIREEVGKVIVGQDRVVECTLTALVCGGNVLLEGVPGLGKTELVKTLSRVLDLEYRRIQFTPDLMPADIVGTNIMTAQPDGTYRFEFRRGPIFTQLLLADEINRATPKTQSALLETMQEGTVTTGDRTFTLDPPFFVMATQNPIEQEGTYPLPEAQLDRFMFKVTVPFLDQAELNEVVNRTILKRPMDVEKVADAERLLGLQSVLDKVVVAPPVVDYAVRLVLGTHAGQAFASDQVTRYVQWGASPRATQAMIRAGRVRALSAGRAHVAFDDVRAYVEEVLGHRVLLNYDGQAENLRVLDLVGELVEKVPEEGSARATGEGAQG